MALRLILLSIVAGFAVLAYAYWVAVSEPVVRRADLQLAGLAQGDEIVALLISDIHVAGPDMPPSRLVEIVEQINALNPDIVLIAGDLVSDKRVATRRYVMAEAVAPLAALHPRLGIFAVLGNHDHWRDAGAAVRALQGAGIIVLDNSAAEAGPLVVGGLDDAFTEHDDLPSTVEAMRKFGGASILLSHSPDPFPQVPSDIGLMFAGHTHCGQIRLPLIGALSYMSEYGDRYACGLINEAGKTLIVGAGVGTSLLPFRIGADPDMWMVTIRGRRR